jgi:hypothetical protein
MEQTKITASNRDDFYRNVYPVVGMDKSELINLDTLPGHKVIVDSAGWYYEKHFADHKIVKFEHLQSCKNYQLDRSQVDYIFTDTKVPAVNIENSVLLLDHSNYLKYKNAKELKETITYLLEKIQSNHIILRMSTINLNDSRFENRIQNLSNINPDNCVITVFNYNTHVLHVEMRTKKNYDFN